MKRNPFIFLFIAALLSCHSKPNGNETEKRLNLEDSTIVNLYMLAPTGHYEQHVAAMLSADGTTNAYKDQIILALKQHQDYIKKEKQGVRNAKVERIEANAQGNMANAFLNVSFGDGSQEEVMVPLVFDGKAWRLQ